MASQKIVPLSGPLVTQNSQNGQPLPPTLRNNLESLSGVSLNDVKVHYNSGLPVHLNALAYTHGSDIHVAPGQDQHLSHEAWHVVQQRQGRVTPPGDVPLAQTRRLNRDVGFTLTYCRGPVAVFANNRSGILASAM
jgi:hypothetical protein